MFLHTTPFVLTPNSTRREKFDDGVTIVTYGSKRAGHLFSGEKGQEKAKKVSWKSFPATIRCALKIEKSV